MGKSLLFLVGGTLLSFLFHNYVMNYGTWQLNLYYAFAFGLGWGMAYFVDQPQWALPTKMGVSFFGIALLIILGLVLFNFEYAIPSVIRFSTVFVAYYLIASFRESKSLRY